MTATGPTVRLRRLLPTRLEKIYRAFLDADAHVGGHHRMSFTSFATGISRSFGGEFLELVPNERLRYTDRLDDANLPGEIRVTVNLKPVSCGTELAIAQEGIPEVIPLDACYLGWQESLRNLARLVEPNVPD